jgi:hypothetical protein
MLTTPEASPEEEAAARALLRDHVADVHAAEDLLGRVQAGVRRRRTRRRSAFAVAALAATGCAAVFIPTGVTGDSGAGARPLAQPVLAGPQTGSLACPDAPPADWRTRGVPPVGGVPAYAHTLVPGHPVAALACPIDSGGHTAALTPSQLANAVAVFAAATPSSGVLTPGPCHEGLARNGELYLVFEYSNGALLTVTGFAQQPCNPGGGRPAKPAEVTWTATNSAAHGVDSTPAQAEALEALVALT